MPTKKKTKRMKGGDMLAKLIHTVFPSLGKIIPFALMEGIREKPYPISKKTRERIYGMGKRK